METLTLLHTRLDCVSRTDYHERVRIIDEFWTELQEKETLCDYDEFASYVLIVADMGHALMQIGDRERALNVINRTIELYYAHKECFEIDFSKDFFYDKILFDKVVCLYGKGRLEESNRLVKQLLQLKPLDESYRIWHEKMQVQKLFFCEKLSRFTGVSFLFLDGFLFFAYDVHTKGLYMALGCALIAAGYYIKHVALHRNAALRQEASVKLK